MVEGLAVGRIVHFVPSIGGEVNAAIVTKVWDKITGCANLIVFVDDVDIDIRRETSRLYSEAGEPGTWHWPLRS